MSKKTVEELKAKWHTADLARVVCETAQRDAQQAGVAWLWARANVAAEVARGAASAAGNKYHAALKKGGGA